MDGTTFSVTTPSDSEPVQLDFVDLGCTKQVTDDAIEEGNTTLLDCEQFFLVVVVPCSCNLRELSVSLTALSGKRH